MKIFIEGKEPLVGKIKISGSKNSSLKLMAAALFCKDTVTLENVPRIEDVTTDVEILKALGAKVDWLTPNKIQIDPTTLTSSEIPYELGSKLRTAALLAGPLLYRFGSAQIAKPQKSKIGFRPINRWLETWEKLGIEVKETDKFYNLKAKSLSNASINFKTNTVMGTENAILSSIFIPEETVITNAAAEPEVDDLIKFLNQAGAEIKRVEERKLVITGAQGFDGGKFVVMPDRNEIVTFITAALVTYGDVEIEHAISGLVLPFMRKLEAMKASFEFSNDLLRVWRNKKQILESINIETEPAPGFMTDWQPLMGLLLTQCTGTGYVHETIYTDRFSYIRELNRMGANITMYKPSQVGMTAKVSDDAYSIEELGEPLTVAKVEGPTELKRERLSITDLRSGAALVLAALSAEGKSEIYGFENVQRGYEHLDEKLKLLGAKIQLAE